MQYQEFLDRVSEMTKDAVPADPERATSATLQTLKERITGGEADDLASQLPAGIKEYLSEERSEEAESFSLPQFYERVASREDRNVGEATYHARSVVGVLRQATSGGELEDIKAQLPKEYEPLFHSGEESE
jgi:uncharacterized protein (DUF2267 family)